MNLENLSVKTEQTKILDSINLTIESGEVIAIMGKNGSGKSTLLQTIMGNPNYQVESGKIFYKGNSILEMNVNERANLGIYLAFQYPIEIPGVNFFEFLRLAYNSKFIDKKLSVFHFRKLMRETLELLGIDEKFMDRNLNEGFSGGEKKRAEILQMFILKPNFIMLDETDSGLDRDAFLSVFSNIKLYKEQNPETSMIIISHYPTVFEILIPDKVVVMNSGRIDKMGDKKLVNEIYESGYKA